MTDARPLQPVLPVAERPIDLVRGTRDWLPDDCARLVGLEALLLDRFSRAGYDTIRTPILEFTELHERKSGAGIVAKLFELSGQGQEGVCLRPELTAGIVRAYTAAEPRALPWRVSHAGPVFRYETPRADRLREFHQVGVERLGDSGPAADAEIVWLADWALTETGVGDTTIRVGHVGLILEMLKRSGLPSPTQAALIETLSEAATEGRNVQALEHGLEQIADWARSDDSASASAPLLSPVERPDDGGIDRLFRTLVPVIVGRRTGREIIGRMRRKWELGHGLLGALEGVRRHVHALAELKGRPDEVLARLGDEYETLAPESVSALRALVASLIDYGIDPSRVELDLGFGRGIGFYSQMVFQIVARVPDGPFEVCGGGRYDGLARVLGSDRDDRGAGFAFGLERLRWALEAQRRRGGGARPSPRGFAVVGDSVAGTTPEAIRLANLIRSQGARAVLLTDRPADDDAEFARRLGLRLLLHVGASTAELRDLENGRSRAVADDDLVDFARTEAGGRS